MVDREVDWPVWVVLGRFWGLCVRSWAALWAYVGGLGAALGIYVGDLGPLWPVLGRSWSLCWRSWAALGAYVGGLGPLLGPMWAVWDRKMGRTGLP